MQVLFDENEVRAFLALREENAKLSHKLDVANVVREEDRRQIDDLGKLVAQCKQSIKERDARIDAFRKLNAESEGTLAARECIIKSLEKQLADLSGELREALQALKGTSARLADTEKISATRLESMNNLMQEVRRLKSENVCIVTNPRNGHIRVVSVAKVDAFRQHGWIVSEQYLVDRPA